VDSADATWYSLGSVLAKDGNDESLSLSRPGDPSVSIKDASWILANGSGTGLRSQEALLLDAVSDIVAASALKCRHQTKTHI
jgi:hypothetical protein